MNLMTLNNVTQCTVVTESRIASSDYCRGCHSKQRAEHHQYAGHKSLQSVLGLERYWYWGIAQYFPVLGSTGYWAILSLAVIPNTNTAWTP